MTKAGSPPYHIRPAGPDDAKQFARLYQEAVAVQARVSQQFRVRTGVDWRRVVDDLVARPGYAVFVAAAGSQLIGFVHARVITSGGRRPGLARRLLAYRRKSDSRRSLVDVSPMGVIEDCYVSEEFRRNGVATALVHSAEAWIRDGGIERIELSVLVAADGAERFWERQGYRDYRRRLSKTVR